MKRKAAALAAGMLLWPASAVAQDIETVVVTASALPGTAVDPAQIPASVQMFSSSDLAQFGSADVLHALAATGAGISLAEAQDNPFQPNLFYRGFEASPLAGDAQGLAVYADGVRLNQPFGDVVNWDLIPDIAIDRLTVQGANPVFGLNALGGSVSLRMKNGFGWQGAEAEALGGSFGRAQASWQYGETDGSTSFYAATSLLNDNGWRDHSPSHLAQGFADFGWRNGPAELHLDVLGAATGLTGNGPAPVQLLAVDRAAVFTFPDKTGNRSAMANLFGTVQIDSALSLQGNAYIGRFRQRSMNGDASDAEACDHGLLCLDDGTLLRNEAGMPIADFLAGGPYAQLDLTATNTLGFGGSLQASDNESFAGSANRLIAGAAYDGGRTDFAARSELGALTPSRGFLGPGIVIDTGDGEIAPVGVSSANDYLGFYAADIFSLENGLSVSLSARFNQARIGLQDRLGHALDGSHAFTRLNPATGLTYKFSPEISVYAGYAEANRAPTPAEFSCASESAPCSLTNFFVADPALKQVVAHTVEAGARGDLSNGGFTLHWQADVYRALTDDDIMFVASATIGRGFFRNTGSTRRQGAELSADFAQGPWLATLRYALTDATFQSPFTLASPDNPYADGNGEINVRPGDRLPSIPQNTAKAALTYRGGERWSVTLAGRYSDGQYLRGDESNLNPQTRPYFVLDAAARFRIAGHAELFAGVEDLCNARYETFGTFSPVGDVPIQQAPGASNPRSLSPAAPRTVYGGIRTWF